MNFRDIEANNAHNSFKLNHHDENRQLSIRKDSDCLLTYEGIGEEDQNGIFLFPPSIKPAPKFMQDLEGNKQQSPHFPNSFPPLADSSQQLGLLQGEDGGLIKLHKTGTSFDTSSPPKGSKNSKIFDRFNNEVSQLVKIPNLEKTIIFNEIMIANPDTEGAIQRRRDKKSQSAVHSFAEIDEEFELKKFRRTKTNLLGTIASFFHIKPKDQLAIEPAKNYRGNGLSQRQFDMIHDKTYVSAQELNQYGHKRKAQDPKKYVPRLKMLLQKHQLVRPDVQADFVKRIIAKVRQNKKSCINKTIEKVQEYSRKIKYLIELFGAMLKDLSIPVHPQRKLKVCWDIIAAFFLSYEMLFIPFIIGFEFELDSYQKAFEMIKDIFVGLDLLLVFHTAIINQGNLISSHRKIAVSYLRKWFTFDLIGTIPYRSILDNYRDIGDFMTRNRFLRMIMLLRILRIFRLRKFFGTLKDDMYSQVISSILSLLRLLGSVIFLAHIVACVWHFVGLLGLESGSVSWISEFGFADQSTVERYVASLYWTVLTMMTVGYGDITPATMVERLLTIFVMLLGCGVFGYAMNSIGVLLQNINAGVSKKRQKYYTINKFMRRKQLSKETQARVQQYLDYLFETQNEGKFEEDAILAMLSDGIQERIRKEINGRVLKENLLFQSIFGTKFLSLLSHTLEEKIYSPSEIIYDQHDRQYCIFFISSGMVELFYGENHQKLHTLEKGEYFGELSFFTNKSRDYGAKSASFTSIFFLKKQQFLEMLEDHNPEKETFHFVKDKLNLYNNFQTLKLHCYSCGKEDHDITGCPVIHYIPNRGRIIAKYLQEQEYDHKHFQRIRRERYHALSTMDKRIPRTKSVRTLMMEENQATTDKKEAPTIISLTKLASRHEDYFEAKPSVNPNKVYFRRNSRSKTIRAPGERSLGSFDLASEESEIKLDSRKIKKNTQQATVYHEEAIIFDTVMNYEIYFPHNNVTKIIEIIGHQQLKRHKMKKIKSQIQDLKSGVGKLLLPNSRNLVQSSAYLGLQARSRYWAFLFGDDHLTRSKSLKRQKSVTDRTPLKSERNKSPTKFYETFKEKVSISLNRLNHNSSGKKFQSAVMSGEY